jgi:hypothetical protein
MTDMEGFRLLGEAINNLNQIVHQKKVAGTFWRGMEPFGQNDPTGGQGGGGGWQGGGAASGSMRERAQQYLPFYQEASSQTGMPLAVLMGMGQVESGFNARAVSPAGAKGVAQFIDSTARQYGVNQSDPRSSIMGQARYLKDLYNLAIQRGIDPSQAMQYAVSWYNTGPGARGLNQSYVNSVFGASRNYGGLGSSGGAPSAAGAATAGRVGDTPGATFNWTHPSGDVDTSNVVDTSASSDGTPSGGKLQTSRNDMFQPGTLTGGGARTSLLETPDAQTQPVAMLQAQGETADVPGSEKVSLTDPGAVEAAAGNDKQPTNEQFQALVDAYSAVRRKQKFPPMSRLDLERTVRGMIAERGMSGLTSLLQGGPAGKGPAKASAAIPTPTPTPTPAGPSPAAGVQAASGLQGYRPPAGPSPAAGAQAASGLQGWQRPPLSPAAGARAASELQGYRPGQGPGRAPSGPQAPIAPGKTGHPAVDPLHPAHNRENLKKALTADPQNPPAGPPRDQNGLFPYNSVWGRGFTLPQLIYNLKHSNPGMDDATLGEALELARPMLTAAATENYHTAMQQAREEGISAGLEKEKMAETARSDLQSQKDEEAMRRQQVKTDAYLKVSDAAQKIRSDRYSQLQSQFDQVFARQGMEKERAYQEKLKTDAATIQYHLDQINLGQRRISDTELRDKISAYWKEQTALINILRTKSQAGGQFGPDEPLRSQILNALDERKKNIDAQVAAWAKANEASPGEVTAPAATETPAKPPMTLEQLGVNPNQ